MKKLNHSNDLQSQEDGSSGVYGSDDDFAHSGKEGDMVKIFDTYGEDIAVLDLKSVVNSDLALDTQVVTHMLESSATPMSRNLDPPIKQTNLSMFLKEARNEKDQLELKGYSRVKLPSKFTASSKVPIVSPLKLETLHNAPMFQVKSILRPERNAQMVNKFKSVETGKLAKLRDERPPHLKFWHNDSSPTPQVKTPIRGLVGHSFTSANNSVESFNWSRGGQNAPSPTKIKSK